MTAALAEHAAGAELVAGIDARGFLVGGAVADRLGIGVLAVRKAGKLPPPVYSETYDLEYGTATLEVPADGIDLTGRNVVIIDDVLATGGTLAATMRLLPRRARTSPAPPSCSNWPPSAAATCSNRCRSTACTSSEAISSKSGCADERFARRAADRR